MFRVNRRANNLIRNFREFALKGNVVELAIAVIIGGAFGRIVTSFVEDVIMPLINPVVVLTGKDWRTITIGPGVAIGKFLGSVVDFLIIALVLFIAIQTLQRFKTRAETTTELPPDPNLVAQEKLTNALENLTQTIEKNHHQITKKMVRE
ncbi:MAG TPA: large conductance mechanosensitive channel protein MscL [Nostocaceae cyanobacterium]|nr:large conductance mechanosensitive channel protein MscL [Nostocaceae cyanobacterium]